uniref:Ig-like domain-containing protein n=1 Tax=Pelusios castaneus TaxID=367368 RepID=A0A8C8SGA5_9SAUR
MHPAHEYAPRVPVSACGPSPRWLCAAGHPLTAQSCLPEELTCSARLTVHPSIQPLFTRKLEDLLVMEGRTARFDCKISGKPLPDVMWYKVSLRARDSRLTFVYEDSECSLVLLGAVTHDSGVYTCTARNLAGEVSCKAELVVRAGDGAGTAEAAAVPTMPWLGARAAP